MRINLLATVAITTLVLTSTHSASAATITLLDVNLAQIEAGMAWHYKNYAREQRAPDRRRYAQAEEGFGEQWNRKCT